MHILDSSNREIAQTSMGRICMALTQITRFMRRWKIERTFTGLQNFRPSGAPSPHPDGLSCPVPLRLLTHHA